MPRRGQPPDKPVSGIMDVHAEMRERGLVHERKRRLRRRTKDGRDGEKSNSKTDHASKTRVHIAESVANGSIGSSSSRESKKNKKRSESSRQNEGTKVHFASEIATSFSEMSKSASNLNETSSSGVQSGNNSNSDGDIQQVTKDSAPKQRRSRMTIMKADTNEQFRKVSSESDINDSEIHFKVPNVSAHGLTDQFLTAYFTFVFNFCGLKKKIFIVFTGCT
jgi:hypothetical protein